MKIIATFFAVLVFLAVSAGSARAACIYNGRSYPTGTNIAGVVCQPGDTEQLSKALRRLIFSRELRRDMGEAAWHIGRDLPPWSAQAQRFAAALAE